MVVLVDGSEETNRFGQILSLVVIHVKQEVVADVRRWDALETIEGKMLVGLDLKGVVGVGDDQLLLGGGHNRTGEALVGLIEKAVFRLDRQDVRSVEVLVSQTAYEVIVVRRLDEVQIDRAVGEQAIVHHRRRGDHGDISKEQLDRLALNVFAVVRIDEDEL